MPRAKKAGSPGAEGENPPGDGPQGGRMSGPEFARLRSALGKSQKELAELLDLSLKAVESYEQGWRNVPSHVERLMYFLLFKLNEDAIEDEEPCWKSKDCPDGTRSACVAFAAKEGRFCWFFTGRLCAPAKASGSGGNGCYTCEVFSRMRARVDGGR
jgi:transcriptional regulator with XRE-family HTH domain